MGSSIRLLFLSVVVALAHLPLCHCSLAATMGAAMASASARLLAASHLHDPAWPSSLIAPIGALAPGRLNLFNFSRPEGLREFYLYVPSTYTDSTAWPLAYYFHGYQGDWQEGVRLNITMDAEAAGYFLIFGQGTFASPGRRGWNGGVCCLFNATTVVDDVAYALTALKMVQAAANIDSRRVYRCVRAPALTHSAHTQPHAVAVRGSALLTMRCVFPLSFTVVVIATAWDGATVSDAPRTIGGRHPSQHELTVELCVAVLCRCVHVRAPGV